MTLPTVTSVVVETITFPPTAKPRGSKNALFLGGAGARGLEVEGKFVKFTAISVYLEDSAVPSLAVKWKGKSAEELMESVEFYRDIVTGPFEKFIWSTTLQPLTGSQYSEKVSENCVAILKSAGTYTDAEAKAIESFKEAFKGETFPPGSFILFKQLSSGSLVITLPKDGSLLETEKAVIDNKLLPEAILESMIGENGVTPEARKSLAARMSKLFTEYA